MTPTLMFLALSLTNAGTGAGTGAGTDAGQILKQVSVFLDVQPHSFSQNFTCGDQANFNQYYTSGILSCGSHACSSVFQGPTVPNTLNHVVGNCSSDQISIYSDNGDNLDLTQADFETLQGSIVSKLFLKIPELLGTQGSLDLESVEASPDFSLDPTQPHSPSFPALNLIGKFTPDGSKAGVKVLYTIVKGVPGVAQVARLRIDESTIYRLKEIKKI